jgi:hypothetical protein
MHMAAVRTKDWQFGVAWADYPEAAVREPARLIDAQRDALLRNIAGHVVSEKSLPVDGRPGRLVVAEGKMGETVTVLSARFVLDGVRLYQVAATGARGGVPEAGVETYLDSFKLEKR